MPLALLDPMPTTPCLSMLTELFSPTEGKHIERYTLLHSGVLAHCSDIITLLTEVQIMRGIDHPSIVRLISFSESEEYYFLVLECRLSVLLLACHVTDSHTQ